MRSLSSNPIVSLLSWQFVPPLASNFALRLFYSACPHRKPSLSAGASLETREKVKAQAELHARIARGLLVVGYLLWTVVGAYLSQTSLAERNFYRTLGLDPPARYDDFGPLVRSHFKRLARRYHPDKVGEAGQDFFVGLRKATETLENDERRVAYERFGPTVLEWGSKLVTEREFVMRGLQYSAAYWIFTAVMVGFVSLFRSGERGGYWRLVALGLAVSFELAQILHSKPSPLLSWLVPNRLPYERVAMVRQAFISFSGAVSQLDPILPRSLDEKRSARDEIAELAPYVERLMATMQTIELEALKLQAQQAQPLLSTSRSDVEADKKAIEGLKDDIAEVLGDMRVRGHPQAGKVWDGAVQQARGQRKGEEEKVGGGSGAQERVGKGVKAEEDKRTSGEANSGEKAESR